MNSRSFGLAICAVLTAGAASAQTPGPPPPRPHPHAINKVIAAPLVLQDFSDCSNGNVSAQTGQVRGSAVVVRDGRGTTTISVSLLGTPNTRYNFFLKCVRKLGDVATNAGGLGSAVFTLPTGSAGNAFAFDSYPDGAPAGNKFQSVRVDFGQAATVPLVRMNAADCTNSNVQDTNPSLYAGVVSAVRRPDGTTAIDIAVNGAPSTTYNVSLRCGRQIGTIGTTPKGAGGTSLVINDAIGSVFAFELAPQGGGANIESAKVTLGQ